ncbi:emerin (Emery-Dreifuss muscular dystrophy) [Poeciliopsis prolifica]|uniref:emerin (Emery-Dreifuss muscular dystrophy) n=1 Tax=Poeciliopsis prolifica TaxID=188132 RepID=UPI0024139172|nr:emerin (Emery-Dreifuss muscular dystrophy) [Poeciliopsis prolifica]
MMPLRERSDAQISDLLTDYGIKHGPVVNSTRSLYERKLEEAMAKDRTFYREEEEEITDIVCRHLRTRKTSANPSAQVLAGSELNGDQPPDQAEDINQSSGADPSDDLKPEQLSETNQGSSTVLDQQTQQSANHHKLEVREPIRRKAAGKTLVVIPAVLALTAVAAGCYYTVM